ncbi:MAG: MFS transporter [bacterium]
MGQRENGIKNVFLLGFVSFLNDLSSEMIMPILPLFIAALGGKGMAVGLVGGVREGVSSLVKIASGYFSDRTGHRKRFVFLGYLNSALFKLLLGASRIWQHVLVVTGLERIGKGLRTAARDAIIAESTPLHRGRGFGIHRAFDTAGAVGGAGVALLLYWFFKLDFRAIILVAAILSFTSLIPLIFVAETRGVPQRVSFSLSIRSLSPRLRAFLLIAAIFYLANLSYMFFILRAQEFFSGIYPEKTANLLPIILYIVSNAVYAAGAIPFGVLSDRVGRRRVLVSGYLLFSITSLGFAFLQSLPAFILLFCAYGVVNAIVDANERAFIADLAPSHLKATALGTFHATIGVMSVIEGAAAGALWQWISPQAAFIYGAAVTGCAAWFFILFGGFLARAN